MRSRDSIYEWNARGTTLIVLAVIALPFVAELKLQDVCGTSKRNVFQIEQTSFVRDYTLLFGLVLKTPIRLNRIQIQRGARTLHSITNERLYFVSTRRSLDRIQFFTISRIGVNALNSRRKSL